MLRRSDEVVLAVDDSGTVVGYITAVTERVLAAYIPFLEVRPEHRCRGIGSELVRRMLDRLRDLYMVDVVFDPELLPFYSALGFHAGVSGMLRRHALRSGSQAVTHRP